LGAWVRASCGAARLLPVRARDDARVKAVEERDSIGAEFMFSFSATSQRTSRTTTPRRLCSTHNEVLCVVWSVFFTLAPLAVPPRQRVVSVQLFLFLFDESRKSPAQALAQPARVTPQKFLRLKTHTEARALNGTRSDDAAAWRPRFVLLHPTPLARSTTPNRHQ
jgi:hypothetical protein